MSYRNESGPYAGWGNERLPPPPPPPPPATIAVQQQPQNQATAEETREASIPSSYHLSQRRTATTGTSTYQSHYPLPPTATTTAATTTATTSISTPYTVPTSTYSPYGIQATISALQQQQQQQQQRNGSLHKKIRYEHSIRMMLFLVPTGMLTLGSHQSSTPVMLFLAWALILYALDLANLRDFIPWTLWLGVPILTLTQGWFFLLDEGRDDSVDSGYDILQMIFQTTNQGVFWVCAACLLMLQFPWFIGTEIQQQQQPPPKPSTMARQCETILHTAATFVVPTLSQCCLTTLLEPWHGRDVVATGAPHLYAGLLLLTMLGLGSCRSSFPVHPISSSSPKDHHRGLHHEHSPEFSIPSRIANAHVSCLLLVPPTMHLAMFRRRIFSSYSGLDDWCDWILSFTIPYLLVVLVRVLHENDIVPTPYGTLNIVSGVVRLVCRGPS